MASKRIPRRKGGDDFRRFEIRWSSVVAVQGLMNMPFLCYWLLCMVDEAFDARILLSVGYDSTRLFGRRRCYLVLRRELTHHVHGMQREKYLSLFILIISLNHHSSVAWA